MIQNTPAAVKQTADMSFVAGAGRANIDLMFSGLPYIPQEGQELFSEHFSIHLGGGVLGTMTNLRRLGIPARAGTYLGGDMFSRFVMEELKREGIEIENLHNPAKNKGIPLNVSVAAITEHDRTFISYTDREGPNPDEADRIYRLCSGAKIVEMHLSHLDVYRKLKEEGAMLVLDVGWENDMPFEKYRPYFELADYWTANRKEAVKISGCATVFEAARYLNGFFKTVLIKLDAEGCLVYDGGERIIPAIPEFTRVDSTGAGDAFLAGFIYGLYHGKTVTESVLLGNITGGKCVSEKGALTAYCNEAELLTLFEKYRSLFGLDR
jgi:sugar/nucleoside kinase (ribokinase family)